LAVRKLEAQLEELAKLGRSYVEIAKNLVELAGAEARVTNIQASVDFKKKNGSLAMMLDGKRKRWTLEIDDDWADMGALADVMETLSTKTKRFYAKNNGQAMILFFLDGAAAKRINELAPETLTRIMSI
jgi:hypothetical protein